MLYFPSPPKATFYRPALILTFLKHVAGVRNALRKTLFGANSSGAGGETKKISESDVSEIRERDAKIKQLSERLQSLESLYNHLMDQHNDQS